MMEVDNHLFVEEPNHPSHPLSVALMISGSVGQPKGASSVGVLLSKAWAAGVWRNACGHLVLLFPLLGSWELEIS